MSSLPSSNCALYRDVKDALYQAPGIADRCLLTGMLVQRLSLPCLTLLCRLFGDQLEIDFWTVAVYYLSREQARMRDPTYKVHAFSY